MAKKLYSALPLGTLPIVDGDTIIWGRDGSTLLRRTVADLFTARAFAGINTVPTAAANTNNTQIASTAYADAAAAAAKAYADGLVVGLWDDRGTYDASGNTFPASGGSGTSGAVKKGDIWTISVAGTLGGVAAPVGSTVRALVDSPGTTAANWALGGGDLGYAPLNSSGASNHALLIGSGSTGVNAVTLTDGQLVVGQTGADPLAKTLSGDATLSASGVVTIAAGAVSLAKMANLAASSILGNNTGSPAPPIALTAAQVKTLLAITTGDVSGLGTMATQAASAVAITGGQIDGTTIGATTAAAVTATSLLSPSLTATGAGADADLLLSPKGNGQIVCGGGGWAYATAASGKASVLFNNGASDTPNMKFAYAANSNFGIDSASSGTAIGGASGQALRFIKNSDESGGAVIAVLDLNGNFGVTGVLSGIKGLTISGAASSINASSNFATNVNTGTSTGTVTIGGGANTVSIGACSATTSQLQLAAGTLKTTPTSGNIEFDTASGRHQITDSSLVRAVIDGTLFTATASQTIANSTAETSLFGTGVGYGKSLPTNFFKAGKTLSIYLSGTYSAALVPGNITVKVKLGSMVIASATITNVLASASGAYWEGWLDLTCRTTGASGTVMPNGRFNYDVGSSLTDFAALNNAGAAVTIDTTAAQALDVTFTWATASASNTITSTTAQVRISD